MKDKIQRIAKRWAPVAVGVGVGIIGTMIVVNKRQHIFTMTNDQLQRLMDEPTGGWASEDGRFMVANSAAFES